MGALVDVLRNAFGTDCSKDGISSECKTLVVVNIEGVFKPLDNSKPVILEQHRKGCLRLVPAIYENGKWVRDPRWAMMGGNYACGDSTFIQACEQLLGHEFYGAVAIHDRYE